MDSSTLSRSRRSLDHARYAPQQKNRPARIRRISAGVSCFSRCSYTVTVNKTAVANVLTIPPEPALLMNSRRLGFSVILREDTSEKCAESTYFCDTFSLV